MTWGSIEPRCETMSEKIAVTIDRETGSATMRRGIWSQTFPAEDLVKKLRFYRGLWARKPNSKGGNKSDDKTPGPWAGHYEDHVRALERAVREWMA